MANLDITQRNLIDRVDLSSRSEFRRPEDRDAASALTAVGLLIAGALGVAAAAALDSWDQWVVLGMIVFTTIGLMIAVSPTRRGI